jgi:hypothetical protein
MVKAREHAKEYLAASAGAAAINYPLWRIAAMGQSGFRVAASSAMAAANAAVAATAAATTSTPHSSDRYRFFNYIRSHSHLVHAFSPPYKGAMATILGMTWARAAIFWGSDVGRNALETRGFASTVATLLPPLVISTAVQCVNMPLVRATVTLQDPQSPFRTVTASLADIHERFGIKGLWHGVSAGIFKTVPKYCVAVYVKNVMEGWLQTTSGQDPSSRRLDELVRSAVKSCTAGIAGAALTNPIDVIRNEMFKTSRPLVATARTLASEIGWYQLCTRGMGKNLVAVSIPVACTIFFTDALIQLRLFR